MSREVDGLKREMDLERIDCFSCINFYVGHAYGANIIVAVCGVGKVNSAMCTQVMINKYSPELVINIGVAGSLSSKIEVLDLVIADSVVQYDVDTSAVGDPVGMISGINLIHIPCDAKELIKRIFGQKAGAFKIHYGTIVSGDQFIVDEKRKRDIALRFNAIAIDMESGSIGQVCHINQVSFCILRAISDRGDGMEYQEFLACAAEKALSALQILLTELSHVTSKSTQECEM